MKRRGFLQALLAMPTVLLAQPAPAVAAPAETMSRSLVLQQSPLAGFQYHSGPSVWPFLRIGQPLSLVREPQNRDDARAVAVHWRDHKLGYVPRHENTAVAQMLDRVERIGARIASRKESHDPWQWAEVVVALHV